MRVSLAALPFLVAGAYLTAPRTWVHLEFDGRVVRWSVNGNEAVAPKARHSSSRLALAATPSIDPMGVETLEIHAGSRTWSLPGRLVPFSFRLPGNVPVGDWWVDETPREEIVFETSLPVEGPFTLDAVFVGRCSKNTSVRLGGEDGIEVNFRRGLINADMSIVDREGRVIAQAAPVGAGEGLRGIAGLALRSALAACLLVLLVFAIGRAATLASFRPPRRLIGAGRVPPLAVPIALLVGVAGTLAGVAGGVLEGVPHVPDSVSFLLSAKWIAAGRVSALLPGPPEHFDVPGTFVQRGELFSFFPVGWPLVLAAAVRTGIPAVAVTPLFGCLGVLLLFVLGAEAYGRNEGWVSGALLASSPLFILLSSSYMSHSACAVFLLLATLLTVRARRRLAAAELAAAGLCLGFAFSMRPGTAVAFAPAIGLYLFGLAAEAPPERRRDWAIALGALAVAALAGSIPALAHNRMMTGEWGLSAHAGAGGNSIRFANAASALGFVSAQLAYLSATLFGWGWPVLWGGKILALTFAFAALPFLLGKARREDLLFAALFLSLVTLHAFATAHGLHGFGARFLLEGCPFLCLLTARGFRELACAGGSWFADGRGAFAVRASAVTVAAILLVGTATSLPWRLSRYRGYNGVDGTLEAAFAPLGGTRALVVMPGDAWYDWGRAARLLSPSLTEPTAFATAHGKEAQVRALFADRPCYRWQRPTLSVCSP